MTSMSVDVLLANVGKRGAYWQRQSLQASPISANVNSLDDSAYLTYLAEVACKARSATTETNLRLCW